jgi:hypothetical protein
LQAEVFYPKDGCSYVPSKHWESSPVLHGVKGEVVPVLNQLCTMPWRRMGVWEYRSIYSWPWHWLEVSGQFHALAALPLGKESLVPTG